ncbi:tyrosine-protein phosphatase [Flavobacterium chuncheonense]|uniref:protein-tyrosine-phosphatase n=1 Tax=Flavobacterium chuncheonense TaxID=2026653 RepID=A0ABW5YK96_9FLAO
MLSLFKKQPKLKELIPHDYTDIHSHVLFGIDDGAKTSADSRFLMESMKAMGFSKIITTPHTHFNLWPNSSTTIAETRRKVQAAFPDLCTQMQLQAASEYYMDEHFVQLLQSEALLVLKDNYILVEMSYLNAPLQLFDIIFELQLKGYTPILAHPERYTFYHNSLKAYEALKKAGCLFQMNLLSSVGYYGTAVANTADTLLQMDMMDFVGSDIHHAKHIAAFDNKVILKNRKTLEKVIEVNQFFK